MKIFIVCVVVLIASLTLNVFMIKESKNSSNTIEQLNNKIERLNNKIDYQNYEIFTYKRLIYVKRYIAQKKLNLDLDFVIESLYIIAECHTSILSNQHIVENEQTLLFDKILEEELHDLLFLFLTNYKNNIKVNRLLKNWRWMKTCLQSNEYKKEQTNSLIKEIEEKFKEDSRLTNRAHYYLGCMFFKEKKYSDAFLHLSKAAKAGHPYAGADLQRNEGIFKQHGIILKPDDIRPDDDFDLR